MKELGIIPTSRLYYNIRQQIRLALPYADLRNAEAFAKAERQLSRAMWAVIKHEWTQVAAAGKDE